MFIYICAFWFELILVILVNRAAHPLPKISGRALGVFISWLLSFTIRASGDIQPVSLAYKVLVRVVTILGSLASVE